MKKNKSVKNCSNTNSQERLDTDDAIYTLPGLMEVEIEDFFTQPLPIGQKAWGIVNSFYHIVLTYMEENNITQADLSQKLGKSKSTISRMFKGTPDMSIRKMIKIADEIGVNIKIDKA